MSDSNKKYGRINVADGTYGGITVAKYARPATEARSGRRHAALIDGARRRRLRRDTHQGRSRARRERRVRRDDIDTGAGAEPAAILDAIAAMVRRLADEPSSVGVAIPGECDASGLCFRLPNV